MSILTSDEVTKRCQDLVYQVAYAFYDSPYILCLKVLAQLEVCAEKRLADMFMISPNELRKYLGTLHVHRLIKRYVNKERSLQPDWKKGPAQPGQPEAIRTRDVPYWYIDYREFANVTKYRIAIMRKQIDEKVKSEVGQRGYVCTSCSKTYDSLDLSHLFNPSTNTFTCENCGVGELVEFDPATRQDSNFDGNGEKQDKMQKFNIATAPIRDALKHIEGITVPSVNILAWIALNVKSLPVPGEEAGKLDPTDKRFQVVIGEDGDEKERLEKARLVEAQRTQNALPVWYTHSTVTGSATTLGLKNAAGPSSSTSAPGDPAQAAKDNEAALAEHYAMMMEHEEDSVKEEKDRSNGEALSTPIAVPEAAVPEVKREIVEDDDEDEMEGIVETSTPMVSVTGTSTPAIGLEMHKTSDVDKGPMLSVGGIMKPLAEITDEDHEVMTSEEYQAWYDAVEASM